ncbi:arsenate reductase ArsC [Candidatus Bathyarchaeota archaeon]|nr:arsenate reductase ArsC [Candidatus Bathyarchaeota archaeon]
MKKKVLFICTHNSARSQIAEAFINSLHGDKYEARSAGIEPRGVNLYAVRVMTEIGIDISNQRSKSIEEFHGEEFEYVATVCDHAKEACPFFPGKEILHKGFEDPAEFAGTKEEVIEKFRQVRNEIKDWIEDTFGNGSSQTAQI